MNVWGFNIKLLMLLSSFMACILLSGCGDGSSSWYSFINIDGYSLKIEDDIKLEKVPLKVDDSEDIVGLYQEVWDDVDYRDSLLIAQKYSRWVGVNVFVKENLDVLESQGLTLDNKKRTQISFKKNDEIVNAVLMEYEIVEWLISDIPTVYISQLFIPNEDIIELMSFTTEDSYSRSLMSNAFKNVN